MIKLLFTLILFLSWNVLAQDKLMQSDLKSYYTSYEIQPNAETNEKQWINKQIGYFSTQICKDSEDETNWVDYFNNSDKSDVVKFSIKDSLPNGFWDFGNYKGEFKDGKQDGEWILIKIEIYPDSPDNLYKRDKDYTGQKNDTSIVHEFYKNGIAYGQWYRMNNNIRYNTINFTQGKLDGEINVYGNKDAETLFGDFDFFVTEINMTYLNGIPSGNFTFSTINFIKKGSYSLGSPIGKWEIYQLNRNGEGYKVWNKDYYSIEIDEKYTSIKESFFTTNSSDNFQKVYYVSNESVLFGQVNWFECKINVKNFQLKKFYLSDNIENQKIKYVIYNGSDEFRDGKKEQEFYKNGKIKLEGVVNQYRKEYDVNGNLINSSLHFNSIFDGIH